MTRAEIRRVVNQMLDHVEWLDHHASARSPKWSRHYEHVLTDLRKWMLKIIEAPVHLKELKPGERDSEEEAADEFVTLTQLNHQTAQGAVVQVQDPASNQSAQDDDKYEEDD